MALSFKVFGRLFSGKTREKIETVQNSSQTNVKTQVATELAQPEPHTHNDEVLQEYLRAIVCKYGHLKLSSMAHSSMEVVISLEEVYTRPRVVPDHPIFQLSPEQEEILQKELLKQFNQRRDLSEEEYDDQIQQLRYRWKNLPPSWQKQSMTIELEEIVSRFSADKPIAVILGEPGSGKSTVLHWFAIQMAKTLLIEGEAHPIASKHARIPLVIDVNDYAHSLIKNQRLSFAEFLEKHCERLIPDRPHRLLDELKRGHWLILLDQLDDIPDTRLREQTMREIVTFITTYNTNLIETETAISQSNAIMIASRHTGYDYATFEQSTHYTLLDFKEKQIEDFLDRRCPAIERFYLNTKQNNSPAEEQLPEHALQAAQEQKSKLLAIIHTNAGIRRLSCNPYMLTILVDLHRSNLRLPQRRIELYEAITIALLNKENLADDEERDLGNEILATLAYHLHKLGASLTKQELREIIKETISMFFPCPVEKVSDDTVERYLENPCLSSGLLILSGTDQYNFKHPTLREYFVASHLMTYEPSKLTQFVRDHFRRANWHEPLRLVIAYKSGYYGKSTEANERVHKHANDLIHTILNESDAYEAILHRSLFFATKSIVDCKVDSIEQQLQEEIANTLFDLYGDGFGTGRYLKLQHEIEEIMLSWLLGQVQEAETSTFSPLLDTWRKALISRHQLPIRQEGAVHLLATLAPDLEDCPQIILENFIPVLLQLAGLQDLPYPDAIRPQYPQPPAIAASGIIEDYAYIALRLLESAGPAGWIHQQWSKWGQELPELLTSLTRHSDDLEHLITPAAFPGNSEEDDKWNTHMEIAYNWQKQEGYQDPYQLQINLLSASETARYPHALLLKQLLDQELASPSDKWLGAWINGLKDEMRHGRNATFQSALSLRLLLSKHYLQYRREIAEELCKAIATPGPIQRQALMAIINIYQAELEQPLFYRDMRYLNNSLGLLKTLRMRYILECIDSFSIIKLNDVHVQKRQLLRNIKEIEYPRALLDDQDPRSLRRMRYLLGSNQIIEILCTLLKGPPSAHSSTALVALHCVIATNPTGETQRQVIQESLKHFEQSAQPLSTEQRILMATLSRLLNGQVAAKSGSRTPPREGSVYILESTLKGLKQLHELEKYQIEGILNACDAYSLQATAWNILRISWEVLSTQYTIREDAFSVIIEALDDENVMVCAAAALLLQHCKTLPSDIRDEAKYKIITLLNEDGWSRLPLNALGNRKISLLDDVLFDTLKVLVAAHD